MARTKYPKPTYNYWVQIGPRIQALLDAGNNIRILETPNGVVANLKDLPADMQKEVGVESFDRICRGLGGVPVLREQ